MTRLQDRMRAYSDPRFWKIKCFCAIPIIALCFLLAFFINTDPEFCIQNFYVPTLDNNFANSTTIRSPTDNVIFFDLELKNRMDTTGVHYNDVHLAFSYILNSSALVPVGEYVVPGFYQGKGKTARRKEMATVTVPLNFLNGSTTAFFRVDLSTRLKFKNFDFLYSSEKRVAVGGVIEVDDTGKNVEKKQVQLT